jgi:hypothetical protein
MERKILTRLGVLAAVVLLALTAVRAAEEATNAENAAEAAREAIEKGDPDNVDPLSIRGEHWTLDITYETPQPVISYGKDGEKQVFWYVIYTVTNNTGADRQYVPSFLLFTNNGVLTRAGVHPEIFKKVQQERAAKYKFLENAADMVAVGNTKIHMGADNARTGMAIFSEIDRAATKFTVFVEGLSGEYVERPDNRSLKKPEPTRPVENDKVIRLRKTLALAYNFPGDKWWRNLDVPVFATKKWTWR